MMQSTLGPISLPAPAAPRRSVSDLAEAMVTAFTARAERAAELVRRGAVEAVEQGRYRVLSAGGTAYFSVREGYCNCPDFAWRGVVPCKHLIAVELTRSLAAESRPAG
jgi:predicted nucleic acid-binding Zn finger protein